MTASAPAILRPMIPTPLPPFGTVIWMAETHLWGWPISMLIAVPNPGSMRPFREPERWVRMAIPCLGLGIQGHLWASNEPPEPLPFRVSCYISGARTIDIAYERSRCDSIGILIEHGPFSRKEPAHPLCCQIKPSILLGWPALPDCESFVRARASLSR